MPLARRWRIPAFGIFLVILFVYPMTKLIHQIFRHLAIDLQHLIRVNKYRASQQLPRKAQAVALSLSVVLRGRRLGFIARLRSVFVSTSCHCICEFVPPLKESEVRMMYFRYAGV